MGAPGRRTMRSACYVLPRSRASPGTILMPLSARRNQPPTCSTPRSVRALSPTWIRISHALVHERDGILDLTRVQVLEEHFHRVGGTHGPECTASVAGLRAGGPRTRRRRRRHHRRRAAAEPAAADEPDPDEAGEFPMVPSAAIIPPKFGIGELLMSPGAKPPPPPEVAAPTIAARPVPRWARSRGRVPCSESSAVRSSTCSTSPWSPSATPHTTASSGVSMSGMAALVDHLAHRPRLGHRLLERPPVRLEHRPDHRPGHRPAGIARDITSSRSRRDRSATPRMASPSRRQVDAADHGDDPAGDEGEHGASDPAALGHGGPLDEPALAARVLLDASRSRRPSLPELRISSGSM